jgi:hypothetical protein
MVTDATTLDIVVGQNFVTNPITLTNYPDFFYSHNLVRLSILGNKEIVHIRRSIDAQGLKVREKVG